jgi:CRP/FNR family transcriptional regulator
MSLPLPEEIGLTRELAAGPETAADTRPAFRPEFDERIAQGRQLIDAAFDKSAPRRMPAGTRIFGPENSSDPVHRLDSGWAYRAIDWPDGRRAIIEIYLPGDTIGIEAAVRDRPVDEVVAVTALTVHTIDNAAFSELMASPVAAAIFGLLAEQQWRIDRLAAALARRDAHERLALMLVDLYDRLRRRDPTMPSSYALPLTQQQIGDHLGLTLVHVNRVLRSLREKDIVSIDHHVVTIRDLERLRQLAGLDKAALYRPGERLLGRREVKPIGTEVSELSELALS